MSDLVKLLYDLETQYTGASAHPKSAMKLHIQAAVRNPDRADEVERIIRNALLTRQYWQALRKLDRLFDWYD